MTLTQFIRENRGEIDRAIKLVCADCRLNDHIRRQWIINDEMFEQWAKTNGIQNQ